MTLNLIQLGSKNVSQTLQIIKYKYYKCDIAKWEWQTSITYMLVCSMYATTTSNDIFEHTLTCVKKTPRQTQCIMKSRKWDANQSKLPNSISTWCSMVWACRYTTKLCTVAVSPHKKITRWHQHSNKKSNNLYYFFFKTSRLRF